MMHDGGLDLIFKSKLQAEAICRIVNDEDLQRDLDLQKSQIWPNYDANIRGIVYEILTAGLPYIDRPGRSVRVYINDICKFIKTFGPSLGFKHEAELTG